MSGTASSPPLIDLAVDLSPKPAQPRLPLLIGGQLALQPSQGLLDAGLKGGSDALQRLDQRFELPTTKARVSWD